MIHAESLILPGIYTATTEYIRYKSNANMYWRFGVSTAHIQSEPFLTTTD